MNVVVVGAGIAGTGAAFAAAAAGAKVVVLNGGSGASSLSTGALDVLPWSDGGTPDGLSGEVHDVLCALGGYVVGEADARLVTTSGVVRRARGRDAGLLDVAAIEERRVAVVRCRRPGWDADALARAWGGGFEAIDATVLRHAGEDAFPDVDAAALHDDPDRLGWLAERLRDALSSAGAGNGWAGVVLPPLLGADRARAGELSARVGVPCGEAMGMPGGPCGARFERARDRVLASKGVRCEALRARNVRRTGSGWSIATEDGPVIDAGAVVIATGGLIGGGIEYAPPEAELATALPAAGRQAFRRSVDAPAALGAFGRALEVPSSLFGAAPELMIDRARSMVLDRLFDRVGLIAGDDGSIPSNAGLFGAGDGVADRPRTWLGALTSGVRAGNAAARLAPR